MAQEINNNDKIQLLFKEFTGVVNAKQSEPFPLEEFAFKDYIINDNILSENIPATLPNGWRSSQLDASSSIANDSITNLSSIGFPQLSFYKKKNLTQATFGSLKTWYVNDGQGGSELKNAISFKFDPNNNSYNYAVYLTFPGSVYSPINMYSNPTFWLFDFKSGFLQFYGEEDDLNGVNDPNIDLNNTPPVISFIKYVGNTGGGGGGGGDSSFNNIDISGNLSLQDNNLMQSLTINGWTVPSTTTYYIIATVPESGANAFGYFTIQLQDVYYQQVSFYAGVMENKNSVIKIISNTNQDIAQFGNIGFKNLNIILYSGIYYLVTVFEPGSGTQSSLLKIILTNNNSNGKDQINLDRYWTLRNDSATDWSSLGPQPPGPWTSTPVGPQPALPPTQVNVSLANTIAIFGGNPHGMTTQPEFFQNHIVMGPNASIVANNGTGTIDICGNLYVNLESTFNQNVFIRGTLDVSNNVDICGNLTVDHIISNAPSTNFHTGLISEANNFYFKVDTPSTGDGFIINLEETTDNKTFKIIDVSGGNNLFKVGGGGITETQHIHPFSNNTYDIGYKDPSIPTGDLRYNNLYVNNVDTNTFTTTDICANIFYHNLSNSTLLDFSSIILSNINENPHWYDIAYIINPNDVSKNLLTQSSAVFEIYIIEDKSTSGISPTTTTMEYLKCEISVFRSGSASIHVLSSGNIPNSSKRNLKSLRVNYGSSNIGGSYVDTGGLFQIQLQDIDSFGNIPIDRKLYYRVYQNNPIDEIIGSLSKIIPNIWTSALTDISNDNPQYDYSGNLYNYPTTYTIDLDFNPNGGTVGGAGVVNGGGRLMYVNDKDSKFTSNVLFSEDVSFNKNVDISGDLTVNNDISSDKLRVNEIESNTSSSISFNNSNISDISNVTSAINFNAKTNMYTDTSGNITTNLTSTGDFGFDTSNKIWSYNEGGNKYILANNKRVWFSTSNLPISSYNGGSPIGITGFNSGSMIIPSEIVNYSMYQDYRSGAGGITDDFTDFGSGFLKYIEVQNNGIIRGGGSKFNNIYITDTQVSPSQEDFFVKLNIKPSGGSWGTAQKLQTFQIPVTTTGTQDLNGDNFISNISVNSGDLLRIELVFSPSNGAKFIFGQYTLGTATYPETSAGLIATGPRAMFWLDIIEYLPQLP